MKELGEQWIEVINGQEHMVKEVSALSYGDCNGCFLFTVAGCGKVTDFAPCSSDTIIKDLGLVNEDGLLGCPFCGEFPTIKEELDENDVCIYAVEHECEAVVITTGWNHNKQGVKDAWNRRN